jgi:Fic family protein
VASSSGIEIYVNLVKCIFSGYLLISYSGTKDFVMTTVIIAPTRIEPARIEEDVKMELVEASLALVRASEKLGAGLPPATLGQVAAMIRVMNSYYSNRIEGNNTRPREIEAALAGSFDEDPRRRALQQESAAHVRLQAEIDRRASAGELEDPSAPDFIRWLHREFYRDVDPAALVLREATTGGAGEIVIKPGEWRDGDVEVGDHVPPPHNCVPAFMDHFHKRFRQDWLHGQATKILAMATAHHRLNFIHPFYDGNGRVSRLMSHAMAHHAGVGAGGLWSVSRGLARGLEQGVPGREEYGEMMRLADRVRQGDRDGRGNLSLAALSRYTKWFLDICIDQVEFMEEMLDFGGMGERLARYAALRGFRAGGAELLRAVLVRGRVERGDVATILGVAPRTARAVIKELSDDGILGSETPRSALELRFPSQTHEILFPRLFEG